MGSRFSSLGGGVVVGRDGEGEGEEGLLRWVPRGMEVRSRLVR